MHGLDIRAFASFRDGHRTKRNRIVHTKLEEYLHSNFLFLRFEGTWVLQGGFSLPTSNVAIEVGEKFLNFQLFVILLEILSMFLPFGMLS